jgi:methyltransferase (TIGR00027 family)
MAPGGGGRAVKPGQVSVTAQRVAAHRLTFDRIPAPYGDPAADIALARDVAAVTAVEPGPMQDYLRARTRFFDGVVTRGLSRGFAQIVTGAAGYDGRSLRYARPGVLWFEVDHPATQQDKRSRLDRLGIDSSHLRFVAADFTMDPVADLLVSAGLDPGRPSLFLLEGVAVYLEEGVLRSLLVQLRRIAADGSRLAISLSVDSGSPERAARRAAFQAAVAATGEPARSAVAPGEAGALLEATGWRPTGDPGSDGRTEHAGFTAAEHAGFTSAEHAGFTAAEHAGFIVAEPLARS